ncbi:hypothetical protein CLOP_g1695 [Closterium sp. NIES-67]|nr:hypothetical protein CLOP_g1695 [Closterium sp. NIES-67]
MAMACSRRRSSSLPFFPTSLSSLIPLLLSLFLLNAAPSSSSPSSPSSSSTSSSSRGSSSFPLKAIPRRSLANEALLDHVPGHKNIRTLNRAIRRKQLAELSLSFFPAKGGGGAVFGPEAREEELLGGWVGGRRLRPRHLACRGGNCPNMEMCGLGIEACWNPGLVDPGLGGDGGEGEGGGTGEGGGGGRQGREGRKLQVSGKNSERGVVCPPLHGVKLSLNDVFLANCTVEPEEEEEEFQQEAPGGGEGTSGFGMGGGGAGGGMGGGEMELGEEEGSAGLAGRERLLPGMGGWAGQVFVLHNVFVDPWGLVFNASHVFRAGGCRPHLRRQKFVYHRDTQVTVHKLVVNLMVPSPQRHLKARHPRFHTVFHRLVHQLPLFLPLAPLLPKLIEHDARFLVHEKKYLHSLALHILGGDPSRRALVLQEEAQHLIFVERLVQPFFQHCAAPSPALWRALRSHHLLPPNGLPLFDKNWRRREVAPVPATAEEAEAAAAAGEAGAAGGAELAALPIPRKDWVVINAQPPGVLELEKAEEHEAALNDNFWFGRIQPHLAGKGFEATRKLFARAALLVTTPGEALLNMIFMPPGATVFEFQPRESATSAHRAFAHVLSLKYASYICKRSRRAIDEDDPVTLYCHPMTVKRFFTHIESVVFRSPVLPGGGSTRTQLNREFIPGSVLRDRARVGRFKAWAACVGRKGRWVENPTPRRLPWDFHGHSNPCDVRGEREGRGYLTRNAADAIAATAKPDAQAWKVQPPLKYEWVLNEGACDDGDGEKGAGGGAGGGGEGWKGQKKRRRLESVPLGRQNQQQKQQLQLQQQQEQRRRRLKKVGLVAPPLNSSSTSWLPFDPSDFCERVLKHRRMLVVGDSKQHQLTQSLINALARDVRKPASKLMHEVHAPEGCAAVLDNDESRFQHDFCRSFIFNSTLCPGFHLDYIRSDRLWIFDPRTPEYDRMPWVLPALSHLATADIILINRGAHWTTTEDFLSGVRSAARYIRQHFPDKLVIYRNTPPGHVECAGMDRPLKQPQDQELLPYYWKDLREQNEAVRKVVEESGAVYMDVEGMLALRWDGHVGMVPGRDKPDCLHYCQPGPLDVYPQFLYNILIRLMPPPPK